MSARVASWLCASLLVAAPLAAQSITGRVLDADTRAPLAGAAVRLVREDGTLVSASLSADNGAFRVTGPAADYQVVVERIGYAVEREAMRLRPNGTIEVEVLLHAEAIALDTLRVETRSRAMINAGYYDRKRMGFGQFIERAQFTKMAARNLADVISLMQGVRVTRQNSFSDVVMRGAFVKRPNCLPLVYLNGAKVVTAYNWPDGRWQWGDNRFNLDDVPADQVEAVEVYKSKESAPIQFLNSDSECGVVMIWARQAR